MTARIGVAVGEAALLPTASLLIADCFPPRVRTRMLGILGMAIYWGSGAALVFGGLLIRFVGGLVDARGLVHGVQSWQAVLILVGAPGLLIALALTVLPEPKRQTAGADGLPSPNGPIRRIRTSEILATYGGLFGAVGLMSVVGYALIGWTPTHLMRAYGWSAGTAGVRLGGGVVVAATLCIWLASSSADRLAARGHRGAKFLVAGWCTLMGLLLGLALRFVQSPAAFTLLASLVLDAAAACIAIAPAAIVEITHPAHRGRALGAYQTVSGVLGAGIGPPAVALAARLSAGNRNGLGPALSLVVSACFLISSTVFWTRRRAFAAASALAMRAAL